MKNRWKKLAAFLANPRDSKRARQEGMTLIEILIVLVLIALVMGVLVGPRVMSMFGESKKELAKTMVRKFAFEAHQQWSQHNPTKQCAANISELTPYMNSKDINDPWGRPYVLLCGDGTGQLPANTIVGVMSKGEKEADPADDIKSWD